MGKNLHIFTGHQSLVFEDIFQGHERHAPGPSPNNRLAPHIFPGKVRHGLPGYQERAVPLGKLGKVDGIISLPLIVHIDRGFRPHKADVCLARQQCRHYMVCPLAGSEIQINALFRK